jgi:hypothetical protein
LLFAHCERQFTLSLQVLQGSDHSLLGGVGGKVFHVRNATVHANTVNNETNFLAVVQALNQSLFTHFKLLLLQYVHIIAFWQFLVNTFLTFL